jgi:hypothetical protein
MNEKIKNNLFVKLYFFMNDTFENKMIFDEKSGIQINKEYAKCRQLNNYQDQ